MQKEYEPIIEKIIQLHKERGSYNWDNFYKDIKKEDVDARLYNTELCRYIYREMKAEDYTLIKTYNSKATALTELGRRFTTYEKKRADEAEKSESDKYDLLQKRFIYKWRGFPFVVSAISALMAIISFCYTVNSNTKHKVKLKEQQRRLDTLSKNIDTLSGRSLKKLPK